MSIDVLKRMAFVLTLSASTCVQAQDKAEKALQKFDQNYPQEKIHLLFNKDHYVAGENLWFKSFVFEGYNRSTISTSLFVELYDSHKKLIDKKMVPLLKGEGSGSFLLASTLKEDVYFVRAYTTWMTNFSEDFNYLQPITVYNPSSPQKLQANTDAAWSATVNPESGTFVDGIKTKFAVRLYSKGMTPSKWNGFLSDTQNPDTPIVKFTGLDQNVGSFSINPQAGKTYQVTLQDEAGKKVSVNLPPVSPSGINLQVESTNSAVKYSIQSKNISADSQPYKILGTINNILVYKANINKMIDVQSASIPTSKLINGVLQLTLFDAKENVVAQRLCFVQPDLLNIKKPNLTSNLNTGERAKNSFTIGKIANYNGYSVVVTDPESSTSEEENSVLSSLWLGDFNSDISRPAQYFTKNHQSEALDALLISEKWNRFNWNNIMLGNYPMIKNKPESYISYKGKVVSQGKPAANADLNLIFKMPEAGMRFHQIKTDASGLFALNNLVFEDTMTFSYQLNSSDKAAVSNTQVYFQPDFSFVPLRKELPESRMKLTERIQGEEVPAKVAQSIANLTSEKFINEKITDIEEVKIKADKRGKTQKLNDQLSSPMFKSANEMVFDFVNENNGMGAINVVQWLQGRVPGLQINSQGGNTTATMRGGNVEIFLDEMKIDGSLVSTISVPEVAMIKVVRGFFMGSSGGGNGAILIYTRRGGITGSVPDTQSKSLKEMKLKGYDKEEPFNNQIYENIETQTLTKDSRSTLYWNPYLPKDDKEPTTVQFYNNDSAKSYKVIIIGFDEENDTPLYYNEILK
ncbi:hypothetical protein NZ698_06595 [Chryseobacterium sp. PBS4-4]|uniref:TonB-dependent receptor plug domain-containing protein n=1 Tax=Chryseobacterium edaphi TaxID=2976532 RepID=A0ABT2W4H4_9FLAO|nr:hypothetical protein [Chryseobacterium edaphi]MCU7616859.1 hypothetical protein [Chryseobacterium edaphi]